MITSNGIFSTSGKESHSTCSKCGYRDLDEITWEIYTGGLSVIAEMTCPKCENIIKIQYGSC